MEDIKIDETEDDHYSDDEWEGTTISLKIDGKLFENTYTNVLSFMYKPFTLEQMAGKSTRHQEYTKSINTGYGILRKVKEQVSFIHILNTVVFTRQ
jgi:hypothetical protein